MVYHVLIVEDDPMVLSINRRYLEKIPGFLVSGTCGSYEEAIRLTSKHTYDLLLVDVNIQGKSGLDLIRALRKREYPAELIMITAAGEQEAIRIGLQCGIVDYILKPFQFKRFEKSIEAFVQRRELLLSKQPITQKQLDQLRLPEKQTDDKADDAIDKGLTPSTLHVILECIDRQNGDFTVNDITVLANLSHVSVRKYLRYLEEKQLIEMRLEYGTVGRPTAFYRKK